MALQTFAITDTQSVSPSIKALICSVSSRYFSLFASSSALLLISSIHYHQHPIIYLLELSPYFFMKLNKNYRTYFTTTSDFLTKR